MTSYDFSSVDAVLKRFRYVESYNTRMIYDRMAKTVFLKGGEVHKAYICSATPIGDETAPKYSLIQLSTLSYNYCSCGPSLAAVVEAVGWCLAYYYYSGTGIIETCVVGDTDATIGWFIAAEYNL